MRIKTQHSGIILAWLDSMAEQILLLSICIKLERMQGTQEKTPLPYTLCRRHYALRTYICRPHTGIMPAVLNKEIHLNFSRLAACFFILDR